MKVCDCGKKHPMPTPISMARKIRSVSKRSRNESLGTGRLARYILFDELLAIGFDFIADHAKLRQLITIRGV
ncbi:hypothetical protein GCM10028819_10150 [Spirosoma humi]